ncbi:MAG: hypothetical protein WBD02_02755 [Acidimicrobiia bacterium]
MKLRSAFSATAVTMMLVTGCSSDDKTEAGSTNTEAEVELGSNSESGTGGDGAGANDNGSSKDDSDGAKPDTGSGGSKNDGSSARLMMPTTADIQGQFGDDLAIAGAPGLAAPTECEGNYAAGPVGCSWKVPQSGVRDGAAQVGFECDNKGKDASTYIQELAEGRAAIGETIEPLDLKAPAGLFTSNENVEVIMAFKVDTQVAPRVCKLGASPMWNDTTGTQMKMDGEVEAKRLVTIAKKLLS